MNYMPKSRWERLHQLMGPMVIGFALLVAASSVLVAKAAGDQKGLDRLIKQARQDRELVVGFPGSITAARAKTVQKVFNKRFGLKVKIKMSQAESAATVTHALIEMKQGLTPSFDVLEMADNRVNVLRTRGGVERIENWMEILAAIDSTVKPGLISPGVLAGYGLAWAHRPKAMVYNPKLISKKDLPQTRRDLANPKFKGKFTLPPWVTATKMGIMHYDPEEWLDIIRKTGQNAAAILKYGAAVQRMLLGEYPFLPANSDYYFRYKKKDPNAPIGLTFFKDITPLSYTMYMVRKGSRHVNSAKLFVLWAATSEANDLWENKFEQSPNLGLPGSKVGAETMRLAKEQGIEFSSWWDSKKNLKKLEWLSSDKGRKWASKISKAQLARK